MKRSVCPDHVDSHPMRQWFLRLMVYSWQILTKFGICELIRLDIEQLPIMLQESIENLRYKCRFENLIDKNITRVNIFISLIFEL